MIAEIQENSDVTYRIYDYNRIDKDGKKRELHFEKAVEILNLKAEDMVTQKPRTVHYYPGCSREVLGRCRYFETERIQVSMGFSFTVTKGSYQVLLCVDGRGGLETEGNRRPLRFMKGDCIFLPAGIGRCHVLAEKGHSGEVYNICSGKTYTAQEILEKLIKLANNRIDVRLDPKRMRPSDTPVICGNHDKLTMHTEWIPVLGIDEILIENLNYWRSQKLKI